MNNDNKVTGWTGWVIFAATLLIIDGFLQVFYGLAAVFNAHWFVYTSNSSYLLNVSGWGWWLMLIGILTIAAGTSLWSGNMFGRVVGAGLAVISALINLTVFPVAPIWTSLAIVVDLMIVYAIAAHGSEMRQLMHQ